MQLAYFDFGSDLYQIICLEENQNLMNFKFFNLPVISVQMMTTELYFDWFIKAWLTMSTIYDEDAKRWLCRFEGTSSNSWWVSEAAHIELACDVPKWGAFELTRHIFFIFL